MSAQNHTSQKIITKAKIAGFGSYLPGEKVGNDYYSSYLDTNNEWIVSRTGIEYRHLTKGESLTDIASIAFSQALLDAKIEASEIDVLIVATTTADNAFPSCSARLHGLHGMKQEAKTFDVGAACNGFVYTLELASMFLSQPHVKHVAIVGADIMSHLLDKQDRSTVVLFGDGAGAFILSKTDENIGFLASDFGTDGTGCDLLYVSGGAPTYQTPPHICMNGREVFTNAVKHMSASLQKSMQKANLTVEDIDLIIPHQANIRIIDFIQKTLGAKPDQVVKTLMFHGNTSAASIPLATCHTYKTGALEGKHTIAFCGFGAGLSWGSLIMRI